MTRYVAVRVYVVFRVWLADRPGSLGELASEIGKFGADLVGIDILERDGARAVDELTVELPEGSSAEALAEALSLLPGVEVEDLRHLVSRVPYSGRDPLDAAVLIADAPDCSELLQLLVDGVCAAFACDWATVLDMRGSPAESLAAAGEPPGTPWLGAFVSGARAGLGLAPADTAVLVGPRDVAWAPVGSSGLVVVAGRDGPPFRGRERQQLQQLSRVAAAKRRDFVADAPAAVDHSDLEELSSSRLVAS